MSWCSSVRLSCRAPTEREGRTRDLAARLPQMALGLPPVAVHLWLDAHAEAQVLSTIAACSLQPISFDAPAEVVTTKELVLKNVRTILVLAIPLIATLAVASLATADELWTVLGGRNVTTGKAYFNCALGANGKRGHLQSRGWGEDIFRLDPVVAYSTEAGVTQSSGGMRAPGARHRAYLETHVQDGKKGTIEHVEHCRGSTSSSWTGTSSCSARLFVSTNRDHATSCFWTDMSALTAGTTD